MQSRTSFRSYCWTRPSLTASPRSCSTIRSLALMSRYLHSKSLMSSLSCWAILARLRMPQVLW